MAQVAAPDGRSAATDNLMAIPAIPSYILGNEAEQASPALRFGLFLPIWTNREDQDREFTVRAGRKSREGTEFARMRDEMGKDAAVKKLVAQGRLPALWTKNDFYGREAWRTVQQLTGDDRRCVDGLIARQSALRAVVALPSLLYMEARSIAPFATGLGNEHPLDNGFAFLNPYGLPYLPGSGVKGVVRRAAEELAHKDFSRMSDGPSEWSLPDVWRLFGFERWPKPQGALACKAWDEWVGGFEVGRAEMDDYLGSVLPPGVDAANLRKRLDEAENDQQRLHILLREPSLHARGALEFWDVVPKIACDRLAVEIMTPHQSHYYQEKPELGMGSKTPHDSGNPNPITFLTVPPGSEFAFHVRCDLPRLKRIAPLLAEEGRWRRLVKAAFEHAFEWLGFGAKTAVGYGTMEPDPRAEIAARERAEREAARRAEEEQERERIAAEQAEAERRAAEEATRKAEFDALPESRKRLIQVEGLMEEFGTSGRVDESRRNQLKSEANRLAEQAASWSDTDERREAADLLERLYELVGWHDPGRNRKQRERQISKRREAIARVRRG